MKFRLTHDQQDMAAALRDLLESSEITAMARGRAPEVDEARTKTWHRLAAMGVTGVNVPEESGGLGMGPVELVTCLEQLGHSGLPGPYVESVAVLPRLLDSTEAGQRWLPLLASGEAAATITYADHVPYALDADRCRAVFRCGPRGASLIENPTLERAESLDPSRRLFSVDGPGTPVAGARVREAFDLGVLGCAAQQAGIGRRMLEMAIDYVRERHQFGRPIGEFQAIKHHLANLAIKLEFARPLLHGACLSLAATAPTSSRDISAARIATGEAAQLAARTALQVHGAIGYTSEHELNVWLTKAIALRSAWGSPGWHRRRVADALAAGERAAVGNTP